ncbi:PHB depolymerase family esterase [Testudinibacter sp. TR-2022]|uniref:PHB depolymerase family esterase n=1 Tax=Testudinibacter sp. TR-2022 TaxID=2585029 RepID=UPI00111AB81C|nr:PHB depolymerase family esterase [Testudinibacter sp. TR-2022]TNH06717.1 Tat pathway signal protein [Pasteurellaceae bacterium Phil11]TNH22852.1 Tat pathway signal protein [Testudinibacter sp. TR-2022]TNH25298.1 Tat pathway signal protein [Testudinibacter sp. TR-2022]
MLNRRQFLITAAGAAMLTVAGCAVTSHKGNTAYQATAITQVFGDGMRLTAVAVEYPYAVVSAQLDKTQYTVDNRNITGVYVSQSVSGVPSASGRFVIITLNPDDDAALLVQKNPPTNKSGQDIAKNGPGNAGDIQESAPTLKAAQAQIQIADTVLLDTDRSVNLVFDAFKQYEYHDAATGKTVRYNLFVPQIRTDERLPLVLFMHDAGVTGKFTQATLYQGNGAIAWATPQAQAEHPCFVLAPQFDEIIADDSSHTSNYMAATINLIKQLQQDHAIDGTRLYTTGQSGGGMMSIAMNIAYPDFFAASYLVACQWNADLLTPNMVGVKWWITVSEDDNKAYPGEILITQKLSEFGAKVARAQWNAQWSAAEFQAAYQAMASQQANVNFVHFQKGSVFKTAAQANAGGASGHTATWQYAYNITPIRNWVFAQRKLT